MKKIMVAFLAVLLLFTSCAKKQQYKKDELFAMNTFVEIQSDSEEAAGLCEDYITKCDNRFSRTYSKSEIYKLNLARKSQLSDDTLEILEKSLELTKATNNAFDVCSGALTELWNITGENPVIPDEDKIENARYHCNISALTFEDNIAKLSDKMTKVDLGGVAKGYTAGKTIELLKDNGVKNAMVSLGGNVAVTGSSENNKKNDKTGWNVGIKNPDDTSDIIGYVNLTDTVVAVSGDYERFFEVDGKRYHHIFDVNTGYPAESHIRSAAVISKDGLYADALSTALFVMGIEKSADFYFDSSYEFEAIIVTDDAKIYLTPKIADAFVQNTDAKTSDNKKYTIVTMER